MIRTYTDISDDTWTDASPDICKSCIRASALTSVCYVHCQLHETCDTSVWHLNIMSTGIHLYSVYICVHLCTLAISHLTSAAHPYVVCYTAELHLNWHLWYRDTATRSDICDDVSGDICSGNSKNQERSNRKTGSIDDRWHPVTWDRYNLSVLIAILLVYPMTYVSIDDGERVPDV